MRGVKVDSYLDGQLISENVSRRQGRATESRRRTG